MTVNIIYIELILSWERYPELEDGQTGGMCIVVSLCSIICCLQFWLLMIMTPIRLATFYQKLNSIRRGIVESLHIEQDQSVHCSESTIGRTTMFTSGRISGVGCTISQHMEKRIKFGKR